MTQHVFLERHRAEVDRIGGRWAITYRCGEGVTVRLKVCHIDWNEPSVFIAEMKAGGDEDFREIATFASCSFILAHADRLPAGTQVVFPDWPSVRTLEFQALTAIWVQLVEVIEFATTVGTHLPSPPQATV